MNNKAALLLGGAVIVYLLFRGKSVSQKRADLVAYMQANAGTGTEAAGYATTVNMFSDTEVNTAYDYVFNYIKKGTRPAPGSALAQAVAVISAKYNIMT